MTHKTPLNVTVYVRKWDWKALNISKSGSVEIAFHVQRHYHGEQRIAGLFWVINSSLFDEIRASIGYLFPLFFGLFKRLIAPHFN